MMKVKVDSANKRVLLRLDQLGERTRRGIRHGFFRLGKDLQAEANREMLRKPKGGRTYMVRGPSGRRRRHVASAPGETHANLTGTLRKSMGWKVRGSRSMEFGYGVSTKPAPEYADAIENGSKRNAPRPSLGNAVTRNTRNAEKHFTNGILREVKR